jgi:SPP1 gp7 family putative phage head morphogenesis protein
MKLFGFEISRGSEVQNLTQKNDKRLNKEIKYETTLTRLKTDIQKWRNALLYAESKQNPNRTELHRIFKDTVLDAHLSACIEQRKNAVLCRDFMICNMQDGEMEEDEVSTMLLKKSWFYKFLSLALDAKYYGFTLVDFGPMIDDAFPEICMVPRQYVNAEFQVVSQTMGVNVGTDINEPRYIPWNMFIGDRYDLGLLAKAAPLVIWKKNGFGNWSEYNEKFGSPMRVGKTNVSDSTLLDNMTNALRNMGSSFWAVMDQGDEIELIETEKSGAYDVYDKIIERVNSELSKLILGQTGTTDEKSFVGSAKVHAAVSASIIASDVKEIEALINERLIPWLNQYHGYNITGVFKFNVTEQLTMIELGDMIAKLAPYMKFKGEWIEHTLNVEIEEMTEDAPEDSGAKKSKTSYENTISSYSFECKACGGKHNYQNVSFVTSDIEEIILQGIYAGVYTPENLPADLYNEIASSLVRSLNEGYGSFEGSNQLYDELKYSVRHFAAAKVYQQVVEMSKLKGGTYAEFRAKASTIFKQYNETWMLTEYNTARNAARTARNWEVIQRDKETNKYGEYQTAGDGNVRPEHAALDGITRLWTDRFWNNYYPPNGWNCRCTTISHEEAESTNMQGFKQPDDVPDDFLYNPGKDETIFSPKHPYFDVKDKEFAMKNFGLPI